MKTAISIPDKVFRRAERFAKSKKLSRSRLYTVALVRLLDADSNDDLTRAYDTAFGDDESDDFAATAARRVLANVEWTEK